MLRLTHGSSPRLRGTVPLGLGDGGVHRFIPAPAGNSSKPSPSAPLAAVHPRACGEQNSTVNSGIVSPGSSPRLRGTAFPVSRAEANIRFIPAPAGNRSEMTSVELLGTVHPRACGEQRKPSPCKMKWSGSSPRLRGTGRVRIGNLAFSRFIPAPAGNRLYT